MVCAPPKTIEFNCFKNYNQQSFVNDLQQVPWHIAFNTTNNIDECVDTWNKLFLDVAESHAPTKICRVKGTLAPWMNSDIISLVKNCDYHLKKVK